MIYNESEVLKNQVFRLEKEGKFDGYARLISPASKILTRIEGNNSVLVKYQIWIVEWVKVDRKKLTDSEYFTQTSLVGKRARRTIEFTNGKRWSYLEGKVEDGEVYKENFDLTDDYGKYL